MNDLKLQEVLLKVDDLPLTAIDQSVTSLLISLEVLKLVAYSCGVN